MPGSVIKPYIKKHKATTNPAKGPAAPISKSALFVRIGVRVRITAPNVPEINHYWQWKRNIEWQSCIYFMIALQQRNAQTRAPKGK